MSCQCLMAYFQRQKKPNRGSHTLSRHDTYTVAVADAVLCYKYICIQTQSDQTVETCLVCPPCSFLLSCFPLCSIWAFSCPSCRVRHVTLQGFELLLLGKRCPKKASFMTEDAPWRLLLRKETVEIEKKEVTSRAQMP